MPDRFGPITYDFYTYPNFPYVSYYWWGAPTGFTDLDLYDYNRNFILDDNEIADIVRDNIAADPGITLSDENRIQVSVKDGVATLSGEVKNPRTKPLAYGDAYWSSGVVDVVNNITVKPRERKHNGNGRGNK